MKKQQRISIRFILVSLCAWSAMVPITARASFHLWDIKEVYSNADGSVQFIELFTTFNGQQFLSGHTLTSTTNTFNFTNSGSPTTNRHLLLATPNFDTLMGGVTPNYTIPINFFDPVSDTLNFAGGFDIRVLSNIPTDGVNSINFPSGTVAANSPTNFAGQIGSLNPSTPGDFDNDGDVDGRDFIIWQRGGSPNGINSGDLALWQSQYGTPLTANATAVPEPNARLLLVSSLLMLWIRRSPR